MLEPTILERLGYAAAYTVTGLVILALGFVVLDLLTPGRLASHVWAERSVNASIVLSAGFLGLGAIVFTTIWTNAAADFGDHLLWTVVFGVFGVALHAVSFLLLDLAAPGKLGKIVCEVPFHPASLVTGAAQLAVSAIVVASIA